MNTMRVPRILGWLVFLTLFGSVNAEEVTLGPELRSGLLALDTISGELTPIDLEGRVVVVSFFASWCPPCRTEFQHLNTLAEEFSDVVSVVAVNVFEQWDDNDAVRLQRFLEDLNPTCAVVDGSEAIKSAFGGVVRIPTVFVFDESGNRVLHFIHERGAQQMTVGIDELRAAVRAGLSL